MRSGKCEFCKTALVVMDTDNGSVLPVEMQEGQLYTDDDVYDKNIHKSHLLNCPKQAAAWVVKRRKYIKVILPGISPKEIHR